MNCEVDIEQDLASLISLTVGEVEVSDFDDRISRGIHSVSYLEDIGRVGFLELPHGEQAEKRHIERVNRKMRTERSGVIAMGSLVAQRPRA